MIYIWRMIMRVIGWKTRGELPKEEAKYVIIVAPHTSNWDFILGVIIRGAMGFKANFLGKDSLFKHPFGFIFKWMGGIPVNRSASQNMVDQVVEEIHKRDTFILAIAPEGTRGKVSKWRTGFYWIALKANIPIVMCQMDYKSREARFLNPFVPTGNVDEDMQYIQSQFKGVKGFSDI